MLQFTLDKQCSLFSSLLLLGLISSRCADPEISTPRPSLDSDLRSASATAVAQPRQYAVLLFPQSVRSRSVYHFTIVRDASSSQANSL